MIRYYGCGVWAGKLFCVVVAVNYLFYVILEYFFPRDAIDVAKDFNLDSYRALQRRHAHHFTDDERMEDAS
jgi:hypothetical protein